MLGAICQGLNAFFIRIANTQITPLGEQDNMTVLNLCYIRRPPQGTVHGPILFLVYINDFHEYLKHSTLRLFADDSTIYKQIHSINNARELQEDLEAAAKWEQDWLMCFHPDKCNVLSATQKQKPVQFIYKLHGHSL